MNAASPKMSLPLLPQASVSVVKGFKVMRLGISQRRRSLLSIQPFRLLLCTLAVLSITPCALAWGRDIRWASLSLTQQQETGINRLESQWQQTHNEVMAQIERDRAELETLLPTGDTQRIRMLQNRMMTNKMYLMNESMNTFLQKRELLTPEQRSHLQKMLPGAPKKSLPGSPTTKASVGH